MLRRHAACFLATLCLWQPLSASASHYSLPQVDFVSSAERKLLANAQIFNTEVLLEWTATEAKRLWLQSQTKWSEGRLKALAARCDLLRIPGIGPTAAEALQRSEVLDTRDLANQVPDELLKKIKDGTRGTPFATRLPALDTLATWIIAAQRLPVILDFESWEVEELTSQIRTRTKPETKPN